MPTGTVQSWLDKRNFGFITPDDGGEEVFCHRACLQGVGFLSKGDVVTYDVEYDERKSKYSCSWCFVNVCQSYHGYEGHRKRATPMPTPEIENPRCKKGRTLLQPTACAPALLAGCGTPALQHQCAVTLQRCWRGFSQRLRSAAIGQRFLASRRAVKKATADGEAKEFVALHRNDVEHRASLRALDGLVPKKKRGKVLDRMLLEEFRRAHVVGLSIAKQFITKLRHDLITGCANGEETWLPPLLLDGPPGSGKRFVADLVYRELAALGVCKGPFREVRNEDDLQQALRDGRKPASSFEDYMIMEGLMPRKRDKTNRDCPELMTSDSDMDSPRSSYRSAAHRPTAPDRTLVSNCMYMSDWEMDPRMEAAETTAYLTRYLKKLQRDSPSALLIFGLNDGGLMNHIHNHFIKTEPVRLILPSLTVEDLAQITKNSLEQRGYTLSGGLDITMLASVIASEWSSGDIARRNGHLVAVIIERALHNKHERQRKLFGTCLNPSTLMPQDFGVNELSRLEIEQLRVRALEELNSMPGLDKAKAYIQGILRRIEYVKAGGNANMLTTCMNLVLTGNPGSGKTTFARLFFRVLRAHGMLKKDVFVEMNALQLKGKYVGHTAPKVIQAVRSARGGCLFLDEAYALVGNSGKKDHFGDEAVHALLTEVENHRSEVLVVLAGYKEKMEQLLAQDPGLSRRFPQSLDLPDYTAAELARIVGKVACDRFGLELEEGLTPRIERHILEEHRSAIRSQNASVAVSLVEKAVELMTRRLVGSGIGDHTIVQGGVLIASDFGIQADACDEKEVERQQLQRELDNLIGMHEPKEHLRKLQKTVEFVRMGGSPKVLETCMNLVLTGNPGTGKSTFARLLFRVLRAHGVLKKDIFIERNALELKGEYCGSTAPKIREIFTMALGGCLFIDEAYALANGDKFSYEAVRMLLTEVENHRTDVLVILAGYDEKMSELFRMDPGLARRFPHTLSLPDYAAREIAAISHRTAVEKFGVCFEVGVEKALEEWIEVNKGRLDASRHNGGLGVRLIEEALHRLAERVTALGPRLAVPLQEVRLSLEDFGLN